MDADIDPEVDPEIGCRMQCMAPGCVAQAIASGPKDETSMTNARNLAVQGAAPLIWGTE